MTISDYTSGDNDKDVFSNAFANQFLSPKIMIKHDLITFGKANNFDLPYLTETQIGQFISVEAARLQMTEKTFQQRFVTIAEHGFLQPPKTYFKLN